MTSPLFVQEAVDICAAQAHEEVKGCRPAIKAILSEGLDQITTCREQLEPLCGGRNDGQTWSDLYGGEEKDGNALAFFLKTLDKWNPGMADKHMKALSKAISIIIFVFWLVRVARRQAGTCNARQICCDRRARTKTPYAYAQQYR